MSFKSDKIRKLLFAKDADKAKGIPTNGVSQFKTKIPKLTNSAASTNVVPNLPSIPKPAKFAKIKNYFKK